MKSQTEKKIGITNTNIKRKLWVSILTSFAGGGKS